MNALVAVVIGVAAALLLKSALGGSSGPHFVTEGGARFWDSKDAAQTAALRKVLEGLKAAKHPSVERVWLLGAVGEPALALVRSIQAKGSVVSSTPNMLEPAAAKGIAEVTPAELMTFADKSAAILPVL